MGERRTHRDEEELEDAGGPVADLAAPSEETDQADQEEYENHEDLDAGAGLDGGPPSQAEARAEGGAETGAGAGTWAGTAAEPRDAGADPIAGVPGPPDLDLVPEPDPGTVIDAQAPAPPPVSDLIDRELAEHERWGRAGAAGSGARADFVAEVAGAGLLAGTGAGLRAGAEVGFTGSAASIVGTLVTDGLTSGRTIKLAGESVRLSSRALPLIGPIIGGAMAVDSLWGEGGLERDATDMFKVSADGASEYQKAADTIQKACAYLDLASNLTGVLAGAFGVASGVLLGFGVASMGALLPAAALAGEIALALGAASSAMSTTQMVIQPLITIFKALDAFTEESDPAAVEQAGARLTEAGEGLGNLLGALGGAKLGGRAAEHALGAGPDRVPHSTETEHTARTGIPDLTEFAELIEAGPIVVEAHEPPRAAREFSEAEVGALLAGLDGPQAGSLTQVEVGTRGGVQSLIDSGLDDPVVRSLKDFGAQPAPMVETDVDWSDPQVLKALGLDPITGRPIVRRDPATGEALPPRLDRPGQLEYDATVPGFDPHNPAPPVQGSYSGHEGMMEDGVWSPDARFELSGGKGISSKDGKTPVGYGVRVGDPGAWLGGIFDTYEDALAHAREVAQTGSGAERSTSALPLEWPRDKDGNPVKGNPVDVVRIVEIPVGTPTILSAVGPQPESAAGSSTVYPGGGPQTQLPKWLLQQVPPGAPPGTPSPDQRGDSVPIRQTVVPDYQPPPVRPEALSVSTQDAALLQRLSAEAELQAQQAAATGQAAQDQAGTAAEAQAKALGAVDVASSATTVAAQRKEQAARSQSAAGDAGDRLSRAADSAAGTAVLVPLLGSFAAGTGVIMQFSSLLPDSWLASLTRMNRDSTRLLGQLTGLQDILGVNTAAQPGRQAEAGARTTRLGAAGQTVAGAHATLAGDAAQLAGITADRQATAELAAQEEQAARDRSRTAADAAAQITADRQAAQTELEAWAAQHRAAREQAIDAKIAELEALGLVVDERPR